MRHFQRGFLLCGIPLWISLLASPAFSAPTDFVGKWVLDPARTESAKGEAITLSIQEDSGKIDYQRTLRKADGKESRLSFDCQLGGAWCQANEDGHKAKMTVWYDGSALMMAKTDGPGKDATTERKLELSADKQTLTVEFTNYSGDAKTEKLVFTKQ